MTGMREYRFSIEGLTPATMPMARLAAYMADLALLLGEPEQVHFVRLEEGSAVLVQQVEAAAVAGVQARLAGIATGEAPPDVFRAFESLDRRLAQDQASGSLSSSDGVEIVRLPGRARTRPLVYGSFRQQGSLDGVLIRIGGKDESVHATLQDGDQTWRCEMTREMARELRDHLFEKPIRVFGEGRWRRDAEGGWKLEHFRISQFEVLDDASWPETVARLRAIEGAEWQEMDDPLAELKRMRDGDEPAR